MVTSLYVIVAPHYTAAEDNIGDNRARRAISEKPTSFSTQHVIDRLPVLSPSLEEILAARAEGRSAAS